MLDFLGPTFGDSSVCEPIFIGESIETGSGDSLSGLTLLDTPDVILLERFVAAIDPP
jgi:hypothetical protein